MPESFIIFIVLRPPRRDVTHPLLSYTSPPFVGVPTGRGVWLYHPATKGVRQKESGKKVTKKVTEASEKVTEK